jgi:oxygen-dependent protoporphyrinogen oxidase
MSRSCVVVGGGLAGLSAAFRLSNAGIRVTVLEAAPSFGGRARTETVSECIVNTGAGFVTSFYDTTLGLLQELRLRTFEPEEQYGVVATPFGKLPLDLRSPRRLLRFPLITTTGKLRALSLFGQSFLRRPVHIGNPDSLARMDRGSTIERWGRRSLGETAYQYLLRTSVEPFFYFATEQASSALAKALVRHARGWHMLAIEGGIGAMCNALAARLEVRTGCKASHVEQSDNSVTVHHSGGKIEADYAILALPAPAAARLEGNLDPDDRKHLEAVRFVPNILLYFGYERPITVQHPLVTPAGPGKHPIARIRTISEWVPSYVPEGKEMVSVHATGWRSAELIDEEPERIINELRRDTESIFGRLADPDWIRLYPRRNAVVLPQPGHYRRARAFLRKPRKRMLYAGDWLTGSTIEGAIRTGINAAEAILAQ